MARAEACYGAAEMPINTSLVWGYWGSHEVGCIATLQLLLLQYHDPTRSPCSGKEEVDCSVICLVDKYVY